MDHIRPRSACEPAKARHLMTERTETRDTLVLAEGLGPYKFLDYFEEKDRLSFAGRERDIGEIVARISVDPTVVLYGRSGLGKSSLLLARVFPGFRTLS